MGRVLCTPRRWQTWCWNSSGGCGCAESCASVSHTHSSGSEQSMFAHCCPKNAMFWFFMDSTIVPFMGMRHRGLWVSTCYAIRKVLFCQSWRTRAPEKIKPPQKIAKDRPSWASPLTTHPISTLLHSRSVSNAAAVLSSKDRKNTMRIAGMHFEFWVIFWCICIGIELGFINQEKFSRMCFRICCKINFCESARYVYLIKIYCAPNVSRMCTACCLRIGTHKILPEIKCQLRIGTFSKRQLNRNPLLYLFCSLNAFFALKIFCLAWGGQKWLWKCRLRIGTGFLF